MRRTCAEILGQWSILSASYVDDYSFEELTSPLSLRWCRDGRDRLRVRAALGMASRWSITYLRPRARRRATPWPRGRFRAREAAAVEHDVAPDGVRRASATPACCCIQKPEGLLVLAGDERNDALTACLRIRIGRARPDREATVRDTGLRLFQARLTSAGRVEE